MTVAVRVVNCPTCGKPVEWRTESRHRPFCSARCREIDLGAWAAEKYCVPGSISGPGGADGGDAMGTGEPS
ncbi:MAG: DNA gyrase inhibitor YacG [Gammaproteobacteria bacterium]|nr:DNA gyrase inhibitor YacG [Gammaproteobacteria bacterium]MBU1645325.1 DNA gyrase inhibitor YacG [Gammaproteobacteria bacterium]MBU1972318.1 DNA gyrase inhibitor YacG [Gammaproteobacteria bacterium]